MLTAKLVRKKPGIHPTRKRDPVWGRYHSLLEHLLCFPFSAAVPDGETLSDPGLINPALGLAVGGFPWGAAAQSGKFQIVLRPLRRGRSARSIGALVGSGS